MDLRKVEAIRSWPTPTKITETRSFHGLASFYHRFVSQFSTLMALNTDCIRDGKFSWTPAAEQAFQTVKKKLCSTLILALPNFTEVFESGPAQLCHGPWGKQILISKLLFFLKKSDRHMFFFFKYQKYF